MFRRPVLRRQLPLVLLLLAVALTAVLAPGPPARAALAERLSVDDLVARCGACLVGTVIEARGRRAADGLIETAYRIRVDERMVADSGGAPGGAFETVVLPGGVLPDGSGLAIPGLARFEVGERALLFLTEADAVTGRRMPVGLDQGQWRLVAGPDGRTLALGGAPAGTDEPLAALGGARAIEYAELRARIEAALQRGVRDGDASSGGSTEDGR